MSANVKIVTDKTKLIELAMDALTKQSVYVGIPSSNNEPKQEPGEPKRTIGNAALGYLHDNGVPERNIPARPSLKPGIKKAQDKIASIFRKAAQNAIAGNVAAVEKGLSAAGMVARDSVKNFIRAGIPPALKEATLAARRRRGRTGTTPLIDTAQLLNSYTYVVRKD